MSDSGIIRMAEKTRDKWGDVIAQLLGLPANQVTFQVVDAGQMKELTGLDSAAAATDPRTHQIYLSRDWFTQHPKDPGAIVHELVHDIVGLNQNYGESAKQIEGLSDAVRALLIRNDPSGQDWQPSKQAQQFLQLTPEQFKTVATHMNEGTYRDGEAKRMADINTGGGPDAPGTNTPSELNNANPVAPPSGDDGGFGDTPPPPDDTTEKASLDPFNLKNTLNAWGIDVTSNLQGMIDRAIERHWTYNKWLSFVRKTPEYHQAFPGIFDEAGHLQMTEQQYAAQKRSYEQIAAQTGLNIGPGRMAYLFRNDVSAAEFQTRAVGLRRLKDNEQLYRQFAVELARGGLIDNPDDLTKKELFKFITQQSNASWYEVWNNAVATNAARDAGIRLGGNLEGDLNLDRATVEALAKKGYSEDQLSQGFADIADTFLNVLPLSRIQGYNLTKQQIIDAKFGGPKSAKTRNKILRIVAQDEAFSAARTASPSTGIDQTGRPAQDVQTQRRAQSY